MVASSTESHQDDLESFLSKERRLNLQANEYGDQSVARKNTPKFDLVPTSQNNKPNIFISDQNPNNVSDLSFNLNSNNISSFLTYNQQEGLN
jgi:hypothetical protein